MEPDTAIESKKTFEARRRRSAVSAMLRSGYTDDEIFEIVSSRATMKNGQLGLGLTRAEMRGEMHKVYAQWASEDSERNPYDKSAAIRRLAKHIREASAAGKWTAVANMEKVLGMIQGTIEPAGGPTVNVITPSRWTDAVMVKVTTLQPDEFREIVEEQRRLNAGQPAQPVNVTEDAKVIEVSPTPE